MAFIGGACGARGVGFKRADVFCVGRRGCVARRVKQGAATMVASLDNAADVELSPEALRCLSFIRGQRSIFDASEGFSAVDAALMRKNDTARSFINDTQLDFATGASGRDLHKKIRDNAETISKSAVDKILAKYGLSSKPTAVKTIEVDSQWILRVVSYGVAGDSLSFLNLESVALYRDVYDSIGGGSSVLVDLIAELKAACTATVGSSDADKFFDSAIKTFESVL
eukprot:CAMPEP_0185844598 /NCGR_PEP_ID=MMETSP1354-20130828/698_1 /TAXON_ID=708628 /ORGANISM="Erythrolobus madagascarensis, Strain CCMP3276" /LENGTH=225 /DNA_ID=CAMNT_0028544283 /DNA_START=42 /DNA_END=719 /DNA_ORIENTATION=+